MSNDKQFDESRSQDPGPDTTNLQDEVEKLKIPGGVQQVGQGDGTKILDKTPKVGQSNQAKIPDGRKRKPDNDGEPDETRLKIAKKIPEIIDITSDDEVETKASAKNSFDELNLSSELLASIERTRWRSPDNLQHDLMKKMLEDENILARVENTDGAIGSYLIPCLQHVNKELEATQVLILVPTHQRMLSVANVYSELNTHLDIKMHRCSDDTNLQDILNVVNPLTVPPKVVISTPSRIVELLRRQLLDLSKCSILILDEADTLINGGSVKMLDSILANTPDELQVFVQCSEMTDGIQRFASDNMYKPYRFGLDDSQDLEESKLTPLLGELDQDQGFDDTRLKGDETEEQLQAFDIQLMKDAVARFNETDRDWTALCAGDQQLKAKYDKLNEHGVTFFWTLIELLYKRVRQEGVDQFCKLDVQFVWNFSTWLRIILKISDGVNSDPNSIDCLLSSTRTVSSGYPGLSAGVGRYEFVGTKAHTSTNGKIRFRRKEYQKAIARFVCALKHGSPDDKMEASHRCGNRPQLCIHFDHIVWESRKMNETRTGCQIYGTAYRCKHSPKCVYTDLNGKWLPCSNSELSSDCHCDDETCRIADVVKPEFDLTSGEPLKVSGPVVEKAKLGTSKCRGCSEQIEKGKFRIKMAVSRTPFWHVDCYKTKNPNAKMEDFQIPDKLKTDFETAWNDEDAGLARLQLQEAKMKNIDPSLRYPTLAEYEELTQFLNLQPITDEYKQYARLLTEKLKLNLLIVNQDGIMRVFYRTTSTDDSTFYKCDYCHEFSNQDLDKARKKCARIRIDSNVLAFTQPEHHSSCQGLAEQNIIFTEILRRCKKLVKDGKLGYPEAYERARTLAFHYHHLTNPDIEPVLLDEEETSSERPEIERDPNLLPNYDLNQPLEGFKNRRRGLKFMRGV